MRFATTERLAMALAVSAGAHLAVLAHAPFAPGPGAVALLARPPFTARIAAAPAPAEELQPQPQPEIEVRAPSAPTAPAAPQAAAQPAGLPSAEIFFRASEVDERATPLNEVDLVYPAAALAERQSGAVTLRLRIDHQGILREAAVVDAQPPGVFESAALEAVRGLKFRPARRNGVAVGSVKTIEVPFHPDCRQTGTCIAGAPDAVARR